MNEPNGLPGDIIVVAASLLAWASVEALLRMRTLRRARRILDRRPASWR